MCCDIDQQEGLNPESSQHSTGCASPERNEDPDEAKFYLKVRLKIQKFVKMCENQNQGSHFLAEKVL